MGNGRINPNKQSQDVRCMFCNFNTHIDLPKKQNIGRKLAKQGWIVRGAIRICPKCVRALRDMRNNGNARAG